MFFVRARETYEVHSIALQLVTPVYFFILIKLKRKTTTLALFLFFVTIFSTIANNFPIGGIASRVVTAR